MGEGRPSRGIRTIPKIPSGSGTCSDLGSCLEVMFHVKSSAFSESLRDIGMNWLPAGAVRRIGFGMRLPSLDSVVSDIFGKSTISVIDYLLEQSSGSINHEEISSRLLRSLKKKSGNVIESVEGYQMTDSQKYRMRLVHAYMDNITSMLSDIDSMINSLVEPYDHMLSSCYVPFPGLTATVRSTLSLRLVRI